MCPANLTDDTLKTASRVCKSAKRNVEKTGAAFVRGLASLVRGTHKDDGTVVKDLGEICPYMSAAIPSIPYQSAYLEVDGRYQWCLLNVQALWVEKPTPPPPVEPKETTQGKCHDLEIITIGGSDREIKLDPKARTSCVTFTAQLGGYAAFIVADIPPNAYELETTLPFKKMRPEGGLQRYEYCFLNGWHYAEKSFRIYITKKDDLPDPVVRVGVYPLAEGLCPQ